MLHFGRNLTYTLLALIVALPLGSLVTVLGFVVWESLRSAGNAPPSGLLFGGLATSIGAILFGIAPAAAIGAPLYAWLACKGWNTVLPVTAISLLPGLLVLALGSPWALPLFVFAPPVALCTHLIVRARLRRDA